MIHSTTGKTSAIRARGIGRGAWWALVALGLAACERPAAPRAASKAPEARATKTAAQVTTGGAKATAQTTGAAAGVPRTFRVKPTGRIVAIGDVHGDINALRGALRAAGVLGEGDIWAGGTTTLVQTGDVLDRGDDEQAIMDLLYRLRDQAAAAGGKAVLLLGNHELMNARGDLRYVTPGGLKDFEDAPGVNAADPRLARFPAPVRARLSAFLPGGSYAKKMATQRVIAIVGDTAFVHGGVLPKHVAYGIGKMNAETSAWLLGAGASPEHLHQPDSPVWTRIYSDPRRPADCATLDAALQAMGAKRMVVGHSVQPQGITSACGEKVWRIDVGMARHYGGRPAALEIKQDGAVRAINITGAP